MPLLDHFHPPLSVRRHWQGFHSAWAAEITRQLNAGLLPPRYFAEPNVEPGGPVEIDVGTFEEPPASGGASTAVATWAPPRPALTIPVDFDGLDLFEVRVMSDEEGPELVAAIELVSPANKDRLAHRKAFLTKCASYLQSGVSVVVVDLVTSRTANLHRELMKMLEIESGNGASSALYAAAYRTRARSAGSELDAWVEPLTLGLPLPVLPLWIAVHVAVRLDLEESYSAACETLRIR